MISDFWFIGDHADFYTSRSCRIGASDVPALIINPENPTESLAGYGRTALTVYQEKIGEKKRDPAGYPAEMGHHTENKTLERVIREYYDYEEGIKFRIAKERYEADCDLARLYNKPMPSARNYQTGGPFLHSVQYYVDGMIAHPDMVYIGDGSLKGKKERWKSFNGIKLDMSKPWLTEAKNARLMAAKRPAGSLVKGYDFNMSGRNGIPMKHDFQVQFQYALFRINQGILALTSDSSDFNIWKAESDKKQQGQIMDIVGKMVKHIELKTMPAELAMNGADVQIMYPEIEEDFIDISGWREEKQEAIIKACKLSNQAKQQQDNWKQQGTDAKDALSVLMKKHGEIRKGSKVLAKWENGATGEKLSCSIKDLKKNYPARYRNMNKEGLIKPSRSYRYVAVKWDGDEDV